MAVVPLFIMVADFMAFMSLRDACRIYLEPTMCLYCQRRLGWQIRLAKNRQDSMTAEAPPITGGRESRPLNERARTVADSEQFREHSSTEARLFETVWKLDCNLTQAVLEDAFPAVADDARRHPRFIEIARRARVAKSEYYE